MQYSDWKKLSIFSYVAGILFFLGYWITYLNVQMYHGITIYPYRDLGYSLLPGGISLIFIGYYSAERSKGRDLFVKKHNQVQGKTLDTV